MPQRRRRRDRDVPAEIARSRFCSIAAMQGPASASSKTIAINADDDHFGSPVSSSYRKS
jgi:hypothetical protein